MPFSALAGRSRLVSHARQVGISSRVHCTKPWACPYVNDGDRQNVNTGYLHLEGAVAPHSQLERVS